MAVPFHPSTFAKTILDHRTLRFQTGTQDISLSSRFMVASRNSREEPQRALRRSTGQPGIKTERVCPRMLERTAVLLCCSLCWTLAFVCRKQKGADLGPPLLYSCQPPLFSSKCLRSVTPPLLRRAAAQFLSMPNSCSDEGSCQRKSCSSPHRSSGSPGVAMGGYPHRRLLYRKNC